MGDDLQRGIGRYHQAHDSSRRRLELVALARDHAVAGPSNTTTALRSPNAMYLERGEAVLFPVGINFEPVRPLGSSDPLSWAGVLEGRHHDRSTPKHRERKRDG